MPLRGFSGRCRRRCGDRERHGRRRGRNEGTGRGRRRHSRRCCTGCGRRSCGRQGNRVRVRPGHFNRPFVAFRGGGNRQGLRGAVRRISPFRHSCRNRRVERNIGELGRACVRGRERHAFAVGFVAACQRYGCRSQSAFAFYLHGNQHRLYVFERAVIERRHARRIYGQAGNAAVIRIHHFQHRVFRFERGGNGNCHHIVAADRSGQGDKRRGFIRSRDKAAQEVAGNLSAQLHSRCRCGGRRRCSRLDGCAVAGRRWRGRRSCRRGRCRLAAILRLRDARNGSQRKNSDNGHQTAVASIPAQEPACQMPIVAAYILTACVYRPGSAGKSSLIGSGV